MLLFAPVFAGYHYQLSYLIVLQPNAPRDTLAVARFASSATKQQSLKERLSELIPAELENVRNVCVETFSSHAALFRSKQFVLNMARSLSVRS